jgi:hypothetical protein
MAFWNLRPAKPREPRPIDRVEHALAILLDRDRWTQRQLSYIRIGISKMANSEALQFSDVKAAVTQLVNDNTASNNAIAAQLKEVQAIVLDFSTKSQAGETISQADYQGVISQLAAIHSSVQANTASVEASTASIQQADPTPAPVVDPTQPVTDPTTDPENPSPVATQTGNGTSESSGTV